MITPPRRHPTRRVVIACSVALGGIALAGCSSTSSPEASGSADTATAARPQVPEPLPPAEFAAFIDEHPDVALINVHTPYEGHIDGTDAFVPFDQILDWDDLPADRSTTLAIYCRSGTMSATAAQELNAAGYTDIIDLAGGMRAWTDAGFELLDQPPTTGP